MGVYVCVTRCVCVCPPDTMCVLAATAGTLECCPPCQPSTRPTCAPPSPALLEPFQQPLCPLSLTPNSSHLLSPEACVKDLFGLRHVKGRALAAASRCCLQRHSTPIAGSMQEPRCVLHNSSAQVPRLFTPYGGHRLLPNCPDVDVLTARLAQLAWATEEQQGGWRHAHEP